MKKNILVTGGAGFFGSILVKKLLQKGHNVTSFDLNNTHFNHQNLRSLKGDIRNKDEVNNACKNIDIIHHNVAQVPIAKDKDLFESVNIGGAKVLRDACIENQVKTLVYTSSSAIFGIPKSNPVLIEDAPKPMESYGKAKYEAEEIFKDLVERSVNVSIVRPRTILGTGRLGIFQILFEWIYQNKNIPVLGSGDNIYQFVHADDLADACLEAGFLDGLNFLNIGSSEYSSMKITLEDLIQDVNSKSRVVSVNKNLAKIAMNFSSSVGISPLGPYHSLMYGESMYFDLEHARKKINYKPKYSNRDLFYETYNWYLENRKDILNGSISGSKHQSKLKKGVLSFLPYFLMWR